MKRSLVLLGIFLTRCDGVKSTLGLDHEGPNEYAAVPLAPLSLPEDFNKTPQSEQKQEKKKKKEAFPFEQPVETSSDAPSEAPSETPPKAEEAPSKESPKTEEPPRPQPPETVAASKVLLTATEEPQAKKEPEPLRVFDAAPVDDKKSEASAASVEPKSKKTEGAAPKAVISPKSSKVIPEEKTSKNADLPWKQNKAVSRPIVNTLDADNSEVFEKEEQNQASDSVDNSWVSVSEGLKAHSEVQVIENAVTQVQNPPENPLYAHPAQEQAGPSEEQGGATAPAFLDAKKASQVPESLHRPVLPQTSPSHNASAPLPPRPAKVGMTPILREKTQRPLPSKPAQSQEFNKAARPLLPPTVHKKQAQSDGFNKAARPLLPPTVHKKPAQSEGFNKVARPLLSPTVHKNSPFYEPSKSQGQTTMLPILKAFHPKSAPQKNRKKFGKKRPTNAAVRSNRLRSHKSKTRPQNASNNRHMTMKKPLVASQAGK